MPSHRIDGRSFNDMVKGRSLKPGDTIGHLTVLAVSGLSGVEREKRAKQEGKPWGRFVAGDRDRVVLAFSLPPRPLWPNGRPNPFKRAKVVKEHRETACRAASDAIEAVGAEFFPWERATLLARFWWPTLGRRDEDGASAALKSHRDGLTDAGLIPDDDTRHLRGLPPSFDVDRKNPRVELTLERQG